MEPCAIERKSSRYCLTCGYELAGLAENRCPECGRAFHPDDLDTFAVWQSQVPGRGHIPLAAFAISLCFCLIVAAITGFWLTGVCVGISLGIISFVAGYAFVRDRS